MASHGQVVDLSELLLDVPVPGDAVHFRKGRPTLLPVGVVHVDEVWCQGVDLVPEDLQPVQGRGTVVEGHWGQPEAKRRSPGPHHLLDAVKDRAVLQGGVVQLLGVRRHRLTSPISTSRFSVPMSILSQERSKSPWESLTGWCVVWSCV